MGDDPTRDERGGERRFGRYRALEQLGAGGMGEVLLARDDLLGRDVAVKTLRSPAGRRGGIDDERFFREARAVAALTHPNIVRIFDMGSEGDRPYLVMEAVRGPTLKQRIEAGPLEPNEVRALGIQIARALAAAHERDILHRDVKPSNIIEAEPGMWKLADFGIARLPDSSITLTGQFLGTPAYAAPESTLSGAFSPASDVYGLAATLYEALTGRTVGGPGAGGSLGERLVKGVPPPSAHRPGIPADLDAAIAAALAIEPARRPSALELADTLARGTVTRPPARRSGPSRAPILLAGAVVIGAAVAAGFLLGRSGSTASAPATAGATGAAAAAGAAPAPASATGAAAAAGAAAAPETETETAAEAETPAEAQTAAAAEAADGTAAVAILAAADASAAAAKVEAPPSAAERPAPPEVPGLAEVKALIAKNRWSSAEKRLQELRKRNPKNAEIPFLLGNLYMRKMWWEHGIDNYRLAIQNDPSYRENATLIRNVIKNLQSPSKSWLGRRFLLQEIGAPALPHLEAASKSGENSTIRKRARSLAAQLKKKLDG